MTDAGWATARVVDELRDHWWTRPGWRPGRQMYTFHITFDHPALAQAAHAYQAALTRLTSLDLVPARWLHLTLHGVGFTDEIAADDLDRVIDAARRRCEAVPSFEMPLGPPIVLDEAIALRAGPPADLAAVRSALRRAVGDALSSAAVVEPATTPSSPHVTLAYSNSAQPASPIVKALHVVDVPLTTIPVTAVHLIALRRDGHSYTWEIITAIPLRDRQSSDAVLERSPG